MTPAQLKDLEREWAAKLRADGFQDIESPSGMVPQPLSHGVTPGRVKQLAQLVEDRAATTLLTFEKAWERKAWDLHCDGMSNRDIATKLCVYRKLVNETFWRLRKSLRRPPGRPKDPDSMRSHDVKLFVRLGPAHIEAMDHVREFLKVNGPEALRAGIVEFAKRISGKAPAGGPRRPWG